MTENITNQGKLVNSLQVSFLKDIPAGDFNPGIYFLVKNTTDENITAQIKLGSSKEFVSTVLYPGWNPELILEIKGVTANTLQYGY